tara:strand:+ start:485 stop:961 length:477 start_codon:yes stop_codon:yes gene_type:complete
MNNNDCGCDDNNSMNILNRNLNQDLNMNVNMNNNLNGNNVNQNIMNNVRQGNNNTRYINNLAQNHQNINDNTNLNAMIANPTNTILTEYEKENNNNNTEKPNYKKEIRMFLYILLALSVNESLKFFINQSIRLNKGSSNRYLFYPLFILVVIIIVSLL